jgi:hypothetical protein
VASPNPYEVPGCQEATSSLERNLVHVLRLTMPAFGTALTSCPSAGTDAAGLHHTLLEAQAPREAAMAERPLGMLGGRETYECPPTVLVQAGAERMPSARECQVRGRGSPRPACSSLVTAVGAGVSVPATARDQGYRPLGSEAFSAAAVQLYEPPLTRRIPAASREAAGSSPPRHDAWRNVSPSNAGSRVNL